MTPRPWSGPRRTAATVLAGVLVAPALVGLSAAPAVAAGLVAQDDHLVAWAGEVRLIHLDEILDNDSNALAPGDVYLWAIDPAVGGNVTGFDGTHLHFAPADGYTGPASFRYEITNMAETEFAAGTVHLDVRPSAPVVQDDDVTVTADSVDVPVHPLANDSDPDGGALALSAHTSPGHGTLVPSGQSLLYTPDRGYRGPDSFTYSAVDDEGVTSATATVRLVVERNTAPAFTSSPSNARQSVITGQGLVALAATDAEGHALSYSHQTGVLPLGVTLRPDGTFAGTTSLVEETTATLRVADGRGGSADTVLVVSVSAAPPQSAPAPVVPVVPAPVAPAPVAPAPVPAAPAPVPAAPAPAAPVDVVPTGPAAAPAGAAPRPPAPAPTTAAPAPRLVLPRAAQPVTAGQGTALQGTAAPGSTVRLLARTAPSTTWTEVRRTVVGADGAFRWTVTPPRTTSLQVEADGQRSAVVTLRVAQRVSLAAVRTGTRSVRFSGRALPAAPGQLVSVHRLGPGGRPVLVGTTRTRRDGTWSLDRTFLGTGAHAFSARTSASPAHAAAASPGVRQVVR